MILTAAAIPACFGELANDIRRVITSAKRYNKGATYEGKERSELGGEFAVRHDDRIHPGSTRIRRERESKGRGRKKRRKEKQRSGQVRAWTGETNPWLKQKKSEQYRLQTSVGSSQLDRHDSFGRSAECEVDRSCPPGPPYRRSGLSGLGVTCACSTQQPPCSSFSYTAAGPILHQLPWQS